jgi:hypothetical protein
MKRDDIFPSKYLKAADLKGKPIAVTIESAPTETLKNTEGKEQRKTVLYFAGAKKSLPLNKTNWDSCADICGDDTDNWPGHRIELYPDKTQMGGKPVDCIRVRAPAQRELLPAQRKAPARKMQKAPAPPPTDDSTDLAAEMNDDIPWR